MDNSDHERRMTLARNRATEILQRLADDAGVTLEEAREFVMQNADKVFVGQRRKSPASPKAIAVTYGS